jgi:hypothetical protein
MNALHTDTLNRLTTIPVNFKAKRTPNSALKKTDKNRREISAKFSRNVFETADSVFWLATP